MSSGEAELYAMIKAATQTKNMMQMLMDWHIEVVALDRSDAVAAIDIAHRIGLGKTRNIEVRYLWIQHEIHNDQIKVTKVHTDNNPADFLTNLFEACINSHSGRRDDDCLIGKGFEV